MLTSSLLECLDSRDDLYKSSARLAVFQLKLRKCVFSQVESKLDDRKEDKTVKSVGYPKEASRKTRKLETRLH